MASLVRNIILIGLAALAVERSSAQDKIIVASGAGEILDIDIATCQVSLVGISPFVFSDIAFTPDGRLWGWHWDSASLFEIDPNDATTNLVGSAFGFNTVSLVAYDDSVLLGIYQGTLYGIQVSTAFTWPIGTVGFLASGDLTWYQGDLFLTATQSQLVRITVDELLTSVTDVEVIGTINGGQGNWFGANTIETSPCPLTTMLLGFDVLSVYAINPSDATVTLICPDVIPNGAFGATSLGEVQAIRDTTRLAMPNVFSPNGDGVNDLLAPILAEGTATYILQIFDRWGNKVFDNAGSSKPWDGRTSAGYECKEGVYFYLLTTTAACNGGQDERHGTVQLLR